MKCHQCDFEFILIEDAPSQITSGHYVSCPNCNMRETLEDFICQTGSGFSYKHYPNEVFFGFSENTRLVAQLIFFADIEGVVTIMINTERLSRATNLIQHLKNIFGNRLHLNVTQTSYDDKFAGCLVCGNKTLEGISDSGNVAYCGDHFHLSILNWVVSTVLKNNFTLDYQSVTQNSFKVMHSYFDGPNATLENFKSIDLAEIFVRPDEKKTVVAVKPKNRELEEVFVGLLETLQSNLVVGNTDQANRLKVMRINY